MTVNRCDETPYIDTRDMTDAEIDAALGDWIDPEAEAPPRPGWARGAALCLILGALTLIADLLAAPAKARGKP